MWSVSTIWSSIRQAKEGQSGAIDEFVRKYREPVVRYARGQGLTPEEAEDLSQETFLLILRDQLLKRADESRGRFRGFLISVVKNVLRNWRRVRTAAKRGGGDHPLSLDAPAGEERGLLDVVADHREEESFDREWMRNLVRLSMDQLRARHPTHHQALVLHLEEDRTYEETAQRMGLDLNQVHHLLKQARAKLGELVREEIGSYCSSREEFDEEVGYMSRYL